MLGVPSVSVPSAPAGNTTAANATAITASAAATRPRVFDLLNIFCLLLRLDTAVPAEAIAADLGTDTDERAKSHVERPKSRVCTTSCNDECTHHH
jgi:hypothetical protein